MKLAHKSALFIAEEGEGIARPIFRCHNPAEGLRRNGWNARVATVLYEEEKHTFNGWNMGEEKPFKTPHFIVAHVMLTPKEGVKPGDPIEFDWASQRELVETARVHGQRFFFDLDDDIWNVPEWNPESKNKNGISGHYDQWIEDINASDGIIVSTWNIWLSAQKSRIRVPIHIVHNAIDYINYNANHRDHDKLRVGWFGTIYHRGHDFQQIIPELYKALEGRRDSVEFWHIGADTALEGKTIRSLLPDFPVDIIEKPWVDSRTFHKGVEAIDIAVIPAAQHKFNDGRSNIVGLACAAGGVPFLASPTHEYVDLNYNIPCLNHSLEQLIDDDEYRANWQANASVVIPEYYSPKERAKELITAFESVDHE
jgi:hypothetical protein